MAKNKFRVVFDTNVFTPENFDFLERGPLIRLCKMGRVSPVYGHVFLEETFRVYGQARKRDDLVKRWIPFITATVDRFCDDFWPFGIGSLFRLEVFVPISTCDRECSDGLSKVLLIFPLMELGVLGTYQDQRGLSRTRNERLRGKRQ